MISSPVELAEYVERRYRLAGSALIEGRNPYNLELDRLAAEARARGAELLSFANYDYLGLAHDARVHDAACAAVRAFGPGVGASRVVGGERSLHRTFEREMAAFVGHEDCLSTVSGYGLNVSLIGHLLGSSDLLLYDELSHNSIATGADLTRATTMPFRHNDLDHLTYLIGRHLHQHKRILIAAEGLYSMDGDIPDLPRLLEIKRRFGAWLMLDEAHSIGVMGAEGRGLSEHFGLDPREIEFVIGTLSKAFVSCGGFVCASALVVDWLRHTLPCFVYSVGATPAAIGASQAALALAQSEPWRVRRLRDNARYLATGATARGLNIGRASGFGIVSVILARKENAILLGNELLQRNIYIPPIIKQATSSDGPRLRMFVSASHTHADIDRALDAIANIARSLGEPLGKVEKITTLSRKRLGLAAG